MRAQVVVVGRCAGTAGGKSWAMFISDQKRALEASRAARTMNLMDWTEQRKAHGTLDGLRRTMRTTEDDSHLPAIA